MKYQIDLIKEAYTTTDNRINLGNCIIKKTDTVKFLLMHKNGFECVHCKTKAVYFELVTDKVSSIRLMTDNGSFMTKDHIIPKNKGGEDRWANCQPMCSRCNFKKQDTIEAPGHTIQWPNKLIYESYIRWYFINFYKKHTGHKYMVSPKNLFMAAQEAFKGEFNLPEFNKIYNEFCNLVYETIRKLKKQKINVLTTPLPTIIDKYVGYMA